MVALSLEYQEILRRELSAQYVAHLPPLVPNKKTAQQNAEKQVNRALSAFLLHAKLGISAHAAAKAVVDDFEDNGIDALYFDAKNDVLHIVQSKFKASEEFKLAEAQSFCAGVRVLIQQDFDAFNVNFKNRQVEIENAFANAEEIRLWVVFTGERISNTAKSEIDRLIADDTHGENERLIGPVQYFGPEEIAAELRERQSYKPVEAELILANDVKVGEPQITWYGMANVADLVNLHNLKGKALYEKNVRYFLGSDKSDVNKGIQTTLREDPAAFFYLNNGVTALCTDVSAKDRKASRRRLKVRGLSIINGAQTVASAAEVMAQPNPPDISKARVMLTLIKANADDGFGPRITKARNSQNTVSVANFASQDPTQERLRQELSGLGISYHFRPEANATPDATSILLDEAVTALSWLAVDARFSVWLKSGKGDVYNTESEAYKTLFTETLAGAHLANAVYFSRAIHELLKQADRSSVGTERLVYRHGLHAIGWAYIKRVRSLIQVPEPVNPASIAARISASFDEHRQRAFDSFPRYGKGPLAFFKSQGDTTPYLLNLLERDCANQNPQTLAPLKASAIDKPFPHVQLLTYLSQHAAQI